jgi:hypothetical protein
MRGASCFEADIGPREALNADRVKGAKIPDAKFANVFVGIHGTSPEGLCKLRT